MAGAFDNFDPTGAKQKDQPVATPQAEAPAASSGGGAFSNFNPTGAAQPQPTTGGASQPSGWGVNWRTGDVTMPQSVQDWGSIAGNEATMGGAQGEAAAARKRLDPLTAASADLAGNILSPTTLLNAVPYVGPELAGGLHQGIKSYAEGNDWKTIAEDAAGGGVMGLFGQGTAALAPKILPKVTGEGLKAGLTYGAHKLFGGWAGGDLYKEGAGLMGVYAGLDKFGEKAGELVKNAAEWPATRQAIQNLILGGGSAARTAAGPYDQWIPGQ